MEKDAQGRMKLQNSRLAFFLTTVLWGVLLSDPPFPKFEVLTKLATHLYQLGLRFPSESTLSMVFVLVNYTESDMWKHTGQCLYSDFLNLKTEFKSCLHRRSTVADAVLGPYLLELPCSFRDLDACLQERLFAGQPAADPPMSMEYVYHLQSKVPLRRSNRQVNQSMNGFQVQPAWMFALMDALERKNQTESKQRIVLANGERLPLAPSDQAASAERDLMRLAKDQAKQAQCLPSKALLQPSKDQPSQMLALHDLPSATLPLALPSTAPPKDVVPKDATTLHIPAEAPESHAPAQPSESIPGGADPTSPYQKIMDKLKISLENRKNAKNQAEKADLDDAPKKLWPKQSRRQKPPKIRKAKIRRTPIPNLLASPRPRLANPKVARPTLSFVKKSRQV